MPINRPRSLQVIDPFLSNVARSYRPHGLIADQLVPRIPVGRLSGQYPIFSRDFWFRVVDNKSSDRAPAKEVDYEWSLDTYLCEEYALKVSITELETDQAEPELRLRQTKTEYLAGMMELAYEARVAAVLDTIANGGQLSDVRTSTPAVNWDQNTATIESNLKGAVLDVYDAIGMTPNVVVIPFKVAYAMAVQEDIRAILATQISGGERNFLELGDRVLPSTIHGMKVMIPQAQRVSTREGAPEGALSELWLDHVRCLYVNPAARWGMPTVAYSIVQKPRTTTRWRETDPDRELIRELERTDEKVVAPDAGHILRSVLS